MKLYVSCFQEMQELHVLQVIESGSAQVINFHFSFINTITVLHVTSVSDFHNVRNEYVVVSFVSEYDNESQIKEKKN